MPNIPADIETPGVIAELRGCLRRERMRAGTVASYEIETDRAVERAAEYVLALEAEIGDRAAPPIVMPCPGCHKYVRLNGATITHDSACGGCGAVLWPEKT